MVMNASTTALFAEKQYIMLKRLTYYDITPPRLGLPLPFSNSHLLFRPTLALLLPLPPPPELCIFRFAPNAKLVSFIAFAYPVDADAPILCLLFCPIAL